MDPGAHGSRPPLKTQWTGASIKSYKLFTIQPDHNVHAATQCPKERWAIVFLPLAMYPVTHFVWKTRCLGDKPENKQLAASTTLVSQQLHFLQGIPAIEAEIVLGGVSRQSSLESPHAYPALACESIFTFDSATFFLSFLAHTFSLFYSLVFSFLLLLNLFFFFLGLSCFHLQVEPGPQHSAHISSLHYLVSSGKRRLAYRWGEWDSERERQPGVVDRGHERDMTWYMEISSHIHTETHAALDMPRNKCTRNKCVQMCTMAQTNYYQCRISTIQQRPSYAASGRTGFSII